MANIKQDYLYTESNDWVKINGNIATVGIDDYSQNEFGEIVFVDLPNVDDVYSKGDDICVVESVKTASDLCAPLSGKVVKINSSIVNNPALVNESCYENGWLYQIEISDNSELNSLITADKYIAYIS